MRTFIAVPLLALLPFASAAVPGGKRCQVAASAVPTPGLEALVMGSKDDAAPSQARLSDAQIERLASLDTKLRSVLEGIEARAAKLPAGERKAQAPNAELASQPLPALVTRFLSEAARDQALVLDFEAAAEFQLANAAALEAKQHGDKTRWCPLCLAVRRGVEADFAWKAGEFGALSPAQEKEAAELAAARDEVRRTWAAALGAALEPEQLGWLRGAQMRWLKSTLQGSVASGMRSLGAQKCEACATTVASKCEFCSIVLGAVDEAKSKS
jgi:hypothetical protein